MKKFIFVLLFFYLSFASAQNNCVGNVTSTSCSYPVFCSTISAVNVQLNFIYIHDGNGINGIADYYTHAQTITNGLNAIFNDASIQFFYYPCVKIINNPVLAFADASICGNQLWDVAAQFKMGLNVIINEFNQGRVENIKSNKFVIGGDRVNEIYVYAHEVGHSFGLFHTHHGTCTETSCPGVPSDGKQKKEIPLSGDYDSGDYCKDTPADPNLMDGDLQDLNCNYAPVAYPEIFCADRALIFQYTPMTDNIMSYSRNICRKTFTQDQICRMHTLMLSSVLEKTFVYYKDKTFTSSQTFNREVIFEGLIQLSTLVTLDFSYANVIMMKDSKIILNKRSKLIARNNTLFFGCNGRQWDGIWLASGEQPKSLELTMGPDAPILVFENSGISDAKVAINTSLDPEPFWWWNITPCTDCGARIDLNNAHLTNNVVGINFRGYNKNNNSKIINSYFGDNANGIALAGTKGLEITKTNFTGNTKTTITAGESFIKVFNNCTFNNNSNAISLSGTFPGSSGCEMGRIGTQPNIFQNNPEAITLWGSIHPKKNTIVNNLISGSSYSATAFYGSNSYLVGNNNYQNNARGIVSNATGKDLNDIKCNIMNNALNTYVLYENDKTQILENDYATTNTNQLALYYAKINDPQGSQANPAGNCFSHTAPDILQVGSSQNFKYNFYDPNTAVDCQEPITSGSYIKLFTDNPSTNCNGKIGPFKSIDPDGNGTIPGIFTPGDTTFIHDTIHIGDPAICWTCIQDSLDHWTDIWLDHDPDGDGVDDNPSDMNNEAFYQAYSIVDQWTNFGLALAQEYNQYNEAVLLLQDLPGFRWKSRLYGIYVISGQYQLAQNVLNSIIPSNAEQSNFKVIQTINLARLQSLQRYIPSASELSTLYNITYSNTPNAGFARSLYYILTGQELDIVLPDLPDGSGPRSRKEENILPIIYPNPTLNITTIDFGRQIENLTLEIYNLQGKKIQSHFILEKQTYNFDLSNESAGIYIVKVTFDFNEILIYKVIKI